MPKPFRITFIPVRGVAATKHDANVLESAGRERFGSQKEKGVPLAIVGGGPSVVEHLEELRHWPGEIWSVNWTCQWLSDNGIASKMVTVDSSIKFISRPALCTGAVFSSCIDPAIFAEFKADKCFDLVEDAPGGVVGGSSTACRIPVFAVQQGYSEIHFFGCEGSFSEGQTHINRNETEFVNYIKVKAGDDVYLSRDDLYLQCECLADIMTEFPHVFINRSGGLLQGMIDNMKDWEVVAISAELKDQMEAVSGPSGMYDVPYVVGG